MRWGRRQIVQRCHLLDSIPGEILVGPYMCFSLDACHSVWGFNVSKSASFTENLTALQLVASVLGPGVCELAHEHLRTVSQFVIALCISWMHALLLSKFYVLGNCLSGADLKSWDIQSGVQTLHSWEWSFRFWVASQLWVTILWVRFMGKLCLSVFCQLLFGFFSFSWCVTITQVVYVFFSEEIFLYLAVDTVCCHPVWTETPVIFWWKCN